MLKKLYDKSKIWFAITWISAYCVLMSVGDSLSVTVGGNRSRSLLDICLAIRKRHGLQEMNN